MRGPDCLCKPTEEKTKVKESYVKFTRLLLYRGLDQRFQMEPLFYFSVYKYSMYNKVGGVAMRAAKGDDDGT